MLNQKLKKKTLHRLERHLLKYKKEEVTVKDIYCAELLEVRKENQILKNKISNVNIVAEVQLIFKEEELSNALINNIQHEQAIIVYKLQLYVVLQKS